MPTVKIQQNGDAVPRSQHVKLEEDLYFTSEHGDWLVTFKGGSPYADRRPSVSGPKGVIAGGVIDNFPDTYPYTACCTSHGKEHCMDPDIVIDGSPPHPRPHGEGDKDKYKENS
jgi:hypothetical protein